MSSRRTNVARWWLGLLLLPAALLTACGDDDYHYPSVSLEFMTACSGADGHLVTVLGDDGTTYEVLNTVSAPYEVPDTTLRIVANYAPEDAADGRRGVLLYGASTTVSPLPRPAAYFTGGVRRDPVSLQSIWMGLDYLNIVLEIKGTDGVHTFHFVEDSVTADPATARRTVDLSLYHDAGDDPEYYTRRTYLSVPLRSYADGGMQPLTVRFRLRNYAGETETYTFDYVPGEPRKQLLNNNKR